MSEGPSPRRGSSGPFEGFSEGEHGRGPTPYKKSHSAKPASLASHAATTGRGDSGVFGGRDGNKGSMQDYEHPQSHAEFESLGAK